MAFAPAGMKRKDGIMGGANLTTWYGNALIPIHREAEATRRELSLLDQLAWNRQPEGEAMIDKPIFNDGDTIVGKITGSTYRVYGDAKWSSQYGCWVYAVGERSPKEAPERNFYLKEENRE